MDEAASLMHARAILEYGYPLLADIRTGWDAFPFHYLMAAGIAIFNDEIFGARFFSALSGTLMLPFFYLLCRKIFHSRAQALISVLLLALMTFEIAWSRQARFYPFLLLLTICGLLTLYTFLERRKVSMLFASALLLLCCICTHPSGYYVALFYLIIVISFSLSNPPKRGKDLSIHPWMMYAGFVLLVLGSALLILMPSNSEPLMKALIVSSQMNYAPSYAFFLRGQMGILVYFSIVGMLLSLSKHYRQTLPLIVGMFIYFCLISFNTTIFAFRYILPILYLLILFAGYAVCWPLEKISPGTKGKKILAYLCVAVLLGIGCRGYDYTLWPRREYILGFTAPQPSWKQAYEMIRERHTRMTETQDAPPPLRTISAMPSFHDIYLGKDTGEKYYVQISYSGIPGDVQPHAPFSSADVLYSLRDILSIQGYLILDAFS